MLTLFLSISVFVVFFAGLSIRMLLKKNGEFRGTCASQNPFLRREGTACGYCGKTIGPGDACPEKAS